MNQHHCKMFPAHYLVQILIFEFHFIYSISSGFYSIPHLHLPSHITPLLTFQLFLCLPHSFVPLLLTSFDNPPFRSPPLPSPLPPLSPLLHPFQRAPRNRSTLPNFRKKKKGEKREERRMENERESEERKEGREEEGGGLQNDCDGGSQY